MALCGLGLLGRRPLDAPHEADGLQGADAEPVHVDLVPRQAMPRARWMGVMVVVPALAERQQRHPPVVGRVAPAWKPIIASVRQDRTSATGPGELSLWSIHVSVAPPALRVVPRCLRVDARSMQAAPGAMRFVPSPRPLVHAWLRSDAAS